MEKNSRKESFETICDRDGITLENLCRSRLVQAIYNGDAPSDATIDWDECFYDSDNKLFCICLLPEHYIPLSFRVGMWADEQ